MDKGLIERLASKVIMTNQSQRPRGPRRPRNNNNRSTPSGGNPNQAARPQQSNNPNQRPPQGGQPNASGGSSRAPFRRNRRRRSGRPLSPSQVVQKYLNLLEQHLINRRRYWEDFDRDEGRHRKRLEKNFFGTIEQLRRFEEKLDERQKDALLRHVERYRPDLTYSSNHELSPVADPVPYEGEFDDPHFTEDQEEAFKAYANDREETVGTIDDYLAYKAQK